MARNKQFDETIVLEKAMKVFWQKGFGAVSIQDLEKATGLNRTSIYNTFENKRNIFKKSIELYTTKIQDLLKTSFEEAPSSKEAIQNWLKAIIDMQYSKDNPDGCLAVISALEHQQHDAETLEMIESLFQSERFSIYDAIRKGIQNGEFPENFDAAGVATTITATTAGLVVLSTAKFPVTMLYESVQAVVKLLDV